jgi:hypothetical protein
VEPFVIQRSSLRAALAMAAALHAIALLLGWLLYEPKRRDALVDIEIAPPPPPVEALPEETARRPEERPEEPSEEPDPAATSPPEPERGDVAIDAGVDAPIDAPTIDAAPPDAAPRPDAAPDAAPLIADIDAGLDPVATLDDAGAPDDAEVVVTVEDAAGGDAEQLALGDGGVVDDATVVASSGGGEAGGSAEEAGAGSGAAGATNEPAVAGAPTTAGTAANLFAYFPAGHTVTALIRFDRLRGSEWAARTERLLRPMPDYRVLFGAKDARIADRFETLVISTPRPRDAIATTLVARTRLARPALRDFLGQTTKIAWSPARGGLLGKRSGAVFPGDRRVFLSPFRGWFLLAQPGDLGTLTGPARGDLDAVEATGALPGWLAGIRTIERESGEDRGPALVVTLALGGQRMELGDIDFGLGVTSIPLPDRVSLAMELVQQGWLVRGNIRFASDADAAEFVTAATTAQQRIDGSRILQLAIGKPAHRVIQNLSFSRTGPRVSYSTSISIADARVLMTIAAAQLDTYYKTTPP